MKIIKKSGLTNMFAEKNVAWYAYVESYTKQKVKEMDF